VRALLPGAGEDQRLPRRGSVLPHRHRRRLRGGEPAPVLLGIITLEVPQNSSADEFLRKWARYLRNAETWRFALTALTIVDAAGSLTLTCEGVTPQKIPDRTYDQTAGLVSWTLLAARITD